MERLTRGEFMPGGDLLLFDGLWGFDQTGHIWAGSSAASGLTRISLGTDTAPDAGPVAWLGVPEDPFAFADMSWLDNTVLISDATSGGVRQVTENGSNLAQSGWLETNQGQALALSQITMISLGGMPYLAATPRDGAQLHLYRLDLAQGQATLIDQVSDTPKSTLTGVSELLTLELDGTVFLLSSSSSEDGLSCHALSASGLALRDTLGPKDDLWVTGMEDIALLEAGGQQFVLGVSAQSGTLSSVRVNPMGALFLADIAVDDLTTRFGGATALDVFQANGRSFAVTGGTDGGIALFELLPGGQLLHHQSLAQDNSWDIGNITDLAVTVTGDMVQILLAGSEANGLTQMLLPLESLGDLIRGSGGNNTLSGTSGDDLLMGYAGNDTLSGGAGQDTLITGTGADRVTGGAGADVFVFTRDGQADTITDFQPGLDRIDLDDWGMLYDRSALSIQGRSFGSTIRWGDEVLHVRNIDGTRIEPEDWSNDDFLF